VIIKLIQPFSQHHCDCTVLTTLIEAASDNARRCWRRCPLSVQQQKITPMMNRLNLRFGNRLKVLMFPPHCLIRLCAFRYIQVTSDSRCSYYSWCFVVCCCCDTANHTQCANLYSSDVTSLSIFWWNYLSHSECTKPIFTKFLGLVEISMEIIKLTSVLWSLKVHCYSNQFWGQIGIPHLHSLHCHSTAEIPFPLIDNIWAMVFVWR